ncbi:MAG: DeoR/GlpR transcriptional regulator [Bacteroidetes bacterium]|nr:DeoR/GlpR transcriptional regulator [Bacteroidota bacterium]
MLKEERLNFILNEVKVRNRVQLYDIAVKLNVSEDTVRRDLKYLDEQGKIKKVHGGAVSNSFHVYSYREDDIYAHGAKSSIAQKAISLIKEEQVLLMSGGTTNLELARHMPGHMNLTIFTPSLPVAMQLLEHENIETIFIGGRLSHEAQIALGGDTLNTLSQVKADICFLGTGYLDVTEGLTEFDWEVVQLKKQMIKASKRIVALTISEKLNSSQRFKVCDVDDIHTLITELIPENVLLQQFHKSGMEIF